MAYTELGRLGNIYSISTAEEHLQIPRETCPMVKSTLGELLLRKEKGFRKILGFGNFCESYNTGLEVMKDEGYDVHFGDVPYIPKGLTSARQKESLAYIKKELMATAEWLSGSLDEERLGEELRRMNTVARKIRRIQALRLKKPFYLRSLATLYLIVGSGHYFGAPEEFMTLLDLLIEELEDETYQPYRGEKVIPLVWAGARGQEFGVYKTIDDYQGALLGWVVGNPLWKEFDESLPPLDSLAKFIVEGMIGGTTDLFRIPVDQQVNMVSAKGIIFYGYFGCSFISVDFEVMRDYFIKRGVASLLLEGSFQVGAPTGQVMTRVRAFMEMLS
ncbi:MAG: 2-hydroxyacyl-CoA dehydratase [Candidatus Tectomicrobia bacterium]|uniref:2-hydroxyacyl-CoA dehydratase n=1 Tax=Tectimicrobiota bacterium TaxID=2528274 RepID=A0A932CQN8_UNCTE|nr:2-hydroxyacyl-CoA dehydratase [Candidatus Tectomicrobia bacterium]